MATINRNKLEKVLEKEIQLFAREHPKCYALYQRAKGSLLDGVPMNWMVRWAGGYPLFVDHAKGAHFTCADGKEFLDFCLGDTGAMVGHSPDAPVAEIKQQLDKGITFMLPTEDAIWVGEELQRRFKLKYWQTTLTATDANRFVLRLCRHITKRPYVLVFDYCYHGSVDETFITINDGIPGPRPGAIGPQVNPVLTTRVIPWNNIPALEQALAAGDIACVLAEPVMTNIGIIHPDPGYHNALRELTRKYGTLLIIDETHTMCAGPGGYTGEAGLEPDILTVGKTIGAGVPAAVYGLSEEVGDRVSKSIKVDESDVGGIGGTLAGNALSLAAMRATLRTTLSKDTFAHTIPLAVRFTDGVKQAIDEFGLPWVINRLGCRAEYWFCPVLPHNGGDAEAAVDSELDRYMHLAAMNRGILMTPFHNMALIAPDVTEADIDYHTKVFREAVSQIME
ncbi:MAG: aspartate aminotransferase family protein [Anaerolineaceae bacterium]|jgi:glutamate-1-semialdehyde 2,1-aminomutase